MLVLPRQDMRDVAQVVQEELGKAGFKVELKIPELGQFIQDWRNSSFDIFASINAGSPDPDDYFYRTFRSGGSTNVFKYSNAELDKLLDDGRKELDAKERKADYDKAQAILACQGPVAHLAYGQLFTAVRANVSGFDIIANHSLGTLGNTTLGK
jgi:peptide/nickel transport system substrate-binding protein